MRVANEIRNIKKSFGNVGEVDFLYTKMEVENPQIRDASFFPSVHT